MNRLFYALVAAFCVQSAAAVHSLSADTLASWIANGPPASFILVDVREPSELASVIGTSACRPYNMPWNSGVLRAQDSLLPKSAAIIVYCASGHRSGAAAAFLDSLDYSTVYSLVNGFGGWTGPTQQASNVRPQSDLPAYSMTALTAALAPFPAVRARARVFPTVTRATARNGVLFAKRDGAGRVTGYFDTRGCRIRER
jgi:rhodanese-related sulfurtransferase